MHTRIHAHLHAQPPFQAILGLRTVPQRKPWPQRALDYVGTEGNIL